MSESKTDNRDHNKPATEIYKDCPIHDQLVEYYTNDEDLDVLAVTRTDISSDNENSAEQSNIIHLLFMHNVVSSLILDNKR